MRDGRRPHPLDEPLVLDPKSLALFDELWALYPCKDREVAALDAWRALNLSLETAALVVAHVRVRLKTGWRGTPVRYVPQLARFLEERRWQERETGAQTSAPGPPEGLLTMRSCDRCGESLEGLVVGGMPTYSPCPRCARAGGEGLSERGGLTS